MWQRRDHPPLEVIPQSQLYAEAIPSAVTGTGTGVYAAYFNNASLTGPASHQAIDATIDHGWGSGSPAPGVNADAFSARWSGVVQPQYSGLYTFHTISDDGVRL